MSTSSRILVAVSASDLHLSVKPPPFRSLEEDWISTQVGYLKQLRKLTEIKTGLDRRIIPCLIPGDLFDRWNAPHEIVNIAMQFLPEKVIAIPGNHDLVDHRYDQMSRTAYGVLVESGRIVNAAPHKPIMIEDGSVPIRVWGFPCGFKVCSIKSPCDFCLEVAMVHSYIWASERTGYPGALEEQKLPSYRKEVGCFTVAIFGDNHKGFLAEAKDQCTVLNCGTFMIRKSDERGYKPAVGLIYSDGSVERYFLDTSKDKYLEDSEILKALELAEDHGFIEGLMSLYDKAMDVEECYRRAVESEKMPDAVKSLILRSIGVGGK